MRAENPSENAENSRTLASQQLHTLFRREVRILQCGTFKIVVWISESFAACSPMECLENMGSLTEFIVSKTPLFLQVGDLVLYHLQLLPTRLHERTHVQVVIQRKECFQI